MVRLDGILQLQRYDLRPANGRTGIGPGEFELLVPTVGRRLRLFYLSYNPDAPCEVMGFQFGPTPGIPPDDWESSRFLRNQIAVAGSIIAKDFGDQKYWQGGFNQSLYLVIVGVATVAWNVAYIEV